MLIEEVIQTVQSLYSKGVQSKDTRLSSRHIYSELLTARSTVLKQQVNKRQKINDACYQPLSCIELEKALPHECPTAPKGNNFILRSKYELPKPISNLDKLLIQYVTSIDGTTRFDKTEFENIKYMDGNKYTGNKPKYYIKNNYLYITTLIFLKAVSANVLLEDPIQGYLFPSMCGENDNCACQDVTEFDFHTDRDSFTSVSKIAQQALIIMFSQMKEDRNANASDDFSTAGKMIHQPE